MEKPIDPIIKKPTTVCIVGGGNSAHILVPFLAESGHRVHLLTRRPHDWHDIVACELTNAHTNEVLRTHIGKIDVISSDPAEVIPDADVVILCMPVHSYRPSLESLAPFLNREKKEIFVGAMYGQAGFNWMVHDIEKKHNLTNITIFAVGSIPWICRTIEYGKNAANYGGKQINLVAVTPADRFDRLNEAFLRDISTVPLGTGLFLQACSFLSLTMSVDNQIIHPSRSYGLWQKYGGKWATKEEIPYFYRDYDQLSADLLQKLDAEYSLVRDAIRKKFPERHFKFMLNYLDLENLNYDSGRTDILASFRDSLTLRGILTPTVEVKTPDGKTHHELNINYRFFTDDIPYGLVIAKWIAEKLEVKTPFIDEIILWAQGLRGEHFLDSETKTLDLKYCLRDTHTSGIPDSYGIYKVDDILD
jgi:hypothetical protein